MYITDLGFTKLLLECAGCRSAMTCIEKFTTLVNTMTGDITVAGNVRLPNGCGES